MYLSEIVFHGNKNVILNIMPLHVLFFILCNGHCTLDIVFHLSVGSDQALYSDTKQIGEEEAT